MNKAEIVGQVAGRVALSRSAAREAVGALFEMLAEALAGGQDVRIAGFGTLGTKDHPARTGPDPRTGAPVSMAESTIPVLKPGKTLGDAFDVGGMNPAQPNTGDGPGHGCPQC